MSRTWNLAVCGLLAATMSCTTENVNDFRKATGMRSLPQIRICREKPSGYGPKQVVAACTSQIARGGLGGVDLGVAHLNRGVAYLELDQHQASRPDLDRAVDILGKSPDGAKHLELAFYNRAILNALTGRREAAESDFDRSRTAFTHWDKSRFHAFLGDYPLAVAEFEKAAEARGPGFVRKAQGYLKRKAMYAGKVDGVVSPDLLKAFDRCARTPRCLRAG